MNGRDSGVVAVEAPAKVNLYLHVTGRRSNGYHELDTLMVFTELGDRLTMAPSDTLSLAVEGPFAASLPSDSESNLVMKAARALADAAGVVPTGQMTLTKNLPVSAGLGSGSSDAAAALKALSRHWEIAAGTVDLAALGLGIGSDIPGCLETRSIFVSGIGDRIEATPPLPPVDILLVNPGVQLSTKSVFEARKGGFSPEARFEKAPGDVRALADLLETRTNDLTDPAIRLSPVIEEVLAAIDSAPGCRLARMSGSGATCFGLFDDAETAARAQDQLHRENWWSGVTRLVG